MSTVTFMALRLVGPSELTKMFGVSRSRTVQISNARDFPAPLAVLAMGSIWNLDDVTAWAERKGRFLNLEALTTDVQAGDDSTP
jgi:prophage regulatory protein